MTVEVEDLSLSSLAEDNLTLRKTVEELQRRLEKVETVAADVNASSSDRQSSARDEYNIERMSLGFWDGKFRARKGWRVLGYYETQDDAEMQCCLDHAIQSGRVSAYVSSPKRGIAKSSHGSQLKPVRAGASASY